MRALCCLLLINTAANIVGAVDKCCPPGQALVLHKAIYKCNITKIPRTLRSNRPEHMHRLPDCPPNEIIAEHVTDQKVPANACVDHVVTKNSEILKVLYCPSDLYKSDKQLVLPITVVQKCCDEADFYNTTSHECVQSDIIPMTLSEKYSYIVGDDSELILFDVNIGIPRCDYALVDYGSLEHELTVNRKTEELVVSSQGGAGAEVIAFDGGTFCRDVTADGQAVARVCHDHGHAVCSNRPCVRKCCPDGQIMLSECPSNRRPSCQPHVRGFSPKFHDVTGKERITTIPNTVHLSDYAILFGDPCDEGKFVLRPDMPNTNDTNFLSSSDGRLVVPIYNTVQAQHQYCMEEVFIAPCDDTPAMDGLYSFICFIPDDEDSAFRKRIQLYTVGLIISCIFIAATILVYLSIPKLQNLHGKTLLCYLTAMLAACISLAYTQKNYVNATVCTVTGYFIYFSFLVSFFWLNVMCFDIWWTFGVIREISGMKQKRERRRFMLYSLYSLTIPFLLTLYTAVMDLLDLYGADSQMDPEMGALKCFFSNKLSHLIHFVLPLLILTLANIIFFILTARYCIRVKGEISRMQSENGEMSKRFQADKAKLIMTLKLFVVMGATWFLEFLSSTFKNPKELWYISDFLNALQGLPIFCIFVLKRNVYELIKVKLGYGEKRRPSELAMTGTTSLETQQKSQIQT